MRFFPCCFGRRSVRPPLPQPGPVLLTSRTVAAVLGTQSIGLSRQTVFTALTNLVDGLGELMGDNRTVGGFRVFFGLFPLRADAPCVRIGRWRDRCRLLFFDMLGCSCVLLPFCRSGLTLASERLHAAAGRSMLSFRLMARYVGRGGYDAHPTPYSRTKPALFTYYLHVQVDQVRDAVRGTATKSLVSLPKATM